MTYGFYPRRRFRKVAVKATTPRKYTRTNKNNSKTPKTTFAKKVQAIISRNVENKLTPSKNYTSQVCLVGSGPSLSWFLMNNWDTYLFTIPQGVKEQERVGNQIKLKRWIIKGQIHPDKLGFGIGGNILAHTQQGYVDIYFGRLNTNEEVIANLPSFLDNGSVSEAPNGSQAQIFKPVNKDAYKIYYHRRFKMSPAAQTTTSPTTGPLLTNNDFSLVKTFGFDVCKYICKNAVLKFDDAQTTPQHEMIRRLALWATWTPAVGDMELVAIKTSYYQITTCSYAEYEDA